MYSATLTSLEPGTEYIYRVGDSTNWSAIPGIKNFSCIFLPPVLS
ncbi:fibronectin type III domain-containing protein [Moorella naiadis]